MNIRKLIKIDMKSKFLLSFGYKTVMEQLGNVGSLFMTSFMIFLGLTDIQIGTVVALAGFTDLLQIVSIFIYKRVQSRKKVIIALRILRYLCFYMLMIIPKLFNGSYNFILLIIVILLIYVFRGLVGGGFVEWNDFFVPNDIKGRYYSTRNLMSNAISICISIVVGNLLDKYKGDIKIYLFIFIVSMLFALMDIIILLRLKDQQLNINDEKSIIDLIKQPLKDKKYMIFVKFSFIWIFAWGFGRPYYNVYSIKYLGLTYSFIAMVGSITSIIKIIVAKIWGNAGDKRGWKKITIISGVGFGLTNMLWIFINPQNIFMYPVLMISNGIFMIGINIAKFNINLKLSSNDNRLAYLGFNATTMGIFSFISTNLCTLFIQSLSKYKFDFGYISVNSYQIAFSLSGILHIYAVYYLAKNIYIKIAQ